MHAHAHPAVLLKEVLDFIGIRHIAAILTMAAMLSKMRARFES